MSHQIVLTFDLDETKVQENAEKEAGRQIAATLMKEVFPQRYYDIIKNNLHQWFMMLSKKCWSLIRKKS